MIKKRPLVWIFAVWILGEIAATLFGLTLTPATGLDALMRERATLETVAWGRVTGRERSDYGLCLTLDDTIVWRKDAVLFAKSGQNELGITDMPQGVEENYMRAATDNVVKDDYMRAATDNVVKDDYMRAATDNMVKDDYMRAATDSVVKDDTPQGVDGGRIRLVIYNEADSMTEYGYGTARDTAEGEDGVAIGNYIMVVGEMTPIAPATNPGQFDRRAWYKAKGISYQMSVEELEITDDRRDVIPELVSSFRERLSDNLRLVVDGDDLGLFHAVFLGDSSELSADSREIFQNGGIAHILAVSGMHISLLGAGLFFLLRKCPVPVWAPPLISASVMLLYVLMAGASPSALRALTMFIAMMVARLTGRSYDALSAAALSGLCMLFHWPELISQAGFQLSFLSVFALHALEPAVEEWACPQTTLEKSLLSSLCATAVTLPVTAWHFYRVPVTGVLVNLAAIPLASTLLVSAALSALLPFLSVTAGRFAAGAGHYIRLAFESLCRANDQLPGSVLTTGRPPLALVVLPELFLLAIFILLKKHNRKALFERHHRKMNRAELSRKSHVRLALCAGIYCVILVLLSPARPKGLHLACLDIGQGDCTVIRADQEVWMIDGGSSTATKIWDYRIKPYLLYSAVSRVDVLAVTHPDDDHLNALCDMLNDSHIRTGTLLLPEASFSDPGWDELKKTAAENKVTIAVIAAGEQYPIGNGTMRCLYPAGEETAEDTNGLSMVLQLDCENVRGYFTGDLGIEQEGKVIREIERQKSENQRLVAQNAQNTQKKTESKDSVSDDHHVFLKVGHHGSKYSSGEEFLKAIEPDFASVSAGRNNRYGHPTPEALARIREAGAVYRVTAWSGAVMLDADGSKVQFRGFLEKNGGNTSNENNENNEHP